MSIISSYDVININSAPYLVAVSKGWIAGAASWSKIGYNATAAADTELDMAPYLQALVVLPSAQAKVVVLSSSTADAAAGVGARTVTLYYLDNTFAEKSEVFTLDGTAAVTSSAEDIYRCQNFRLTTVGASGVPQGTISVKDTDETLTYITISLGRTRARQCVWTVPKSKELYINTVNLSTMSGVKHATVRFTTRATYDNLAGTTGTIWIPYHEIVLQDNSFGLYLDPPTKFPTGVDLKVSAISTTSTPQLTCSLRGWTQSI